jgi:hypothetical protein
MTEVKLVPVSSLDDMTEEQRQTSVNILDADTQRKVEEDADLPF